MGTWIATNAGVILTQLIGVGLMAFFAMLVNRKLKDYVTEKAWTIQNLRVEHRLNNVEMVANAARDVTESFQKETLQRLTRIETLLERHPDKRP